MRIREILNESEYDDPILNSDEKQNYKITKMNVRNNIWDTCYNKFKYMWSYNIDLLNSLLTKQGTTKNFLYARQTLIKAKNLWTKNPMQAYLFARNVIKTRFPEGEPAILTSPEYSLFYAEHVLDRQWKKLNQLWQLILRYGTNIKN